MAVNRVELVYSKIRKREEENSLCFDDVADRNEYAGNRSKMAKS